MIRSMRRVGTVLLAFAVLMTAAGCGKKNKALTEKQLTELLPDTITTYSMDDAQHVQEVESLKVIKRNTDEDTDFVECEIVLKDDSVQRTVYADLYLTYYETGGWLIDGWSPYAEETAVPLTVPDGEEARQIAVTMYPEAVWMEDDTSMLEQGVWRSTFEINEEHRYADFQGTLTVKGTFSGWSATSEEMAAYDWDVYLDTHDVQGDYRVEGVYLLTEQVDDLPDMVYLNLESYDEEGSDEGTGYYAFPEFSSTYKGHYGSYSLGNVSVVRFGDSVDALRIEIRLDFYHPVTIVLTADEISVEAVNLDGNGFDVQKDPSPEEYAEWDDFPKDSEYDFPTA